MKNDNFKNRNIARPGYDPDFDDPFDADDADSFSVEASDPVDPDGNAQVPELDDLDSFEELEGFEDLDVTPAGQRSGSGQAGSGQTGTGSRTDSRRAGSGDDGLSGKRKDGSGRKEKARELNTADTAVDARKLNDEKKKQKKSRVRKIIFWSVLEVVTLACIFVYGYFLRTWNLITRPEVNEKNIENNNISLEKKKEMEQGYWTFAVFGVDGRSSSDLVSKGLNSDVILIVNINQDTGEIRMCSVYRDTYLNISDKDSYRKINAAYCNGGPEQALAALNKNLDLNIKNYVTFNWKAVVDGINILGGVDDIEISKAEFYYINAFITETVEVTRVGSHHLTSPGVQHLDGVQAVAYGRLRLMDSDFARVERQKKIIAACFEKAKHASFSVLNNIIVVCVPEVATNIGINNVVAMAQNIDKYYISESGGFPWQRSESAYSSTGDVVVPATLESNVRRLHAFLYGDEDYQPSNAVMKYSETIKEKTGIYKEGQVVEHVRTDGGLISMPKTTAAETEGESVQVETDAEGNVIVRPTIGIDEDGNYVYPTDADGNEIIPTDEHGNVQYPTDENGDIIYEYDEDGNVINPTDADGNPVTLPAAQQEETEESSEPGSQGETSHGDDVREEDGPGVQPGAENQPTYPAPGDRTTEATTEGFGPGNPQPGPGESSSQEQQPGGNDEPGGENGPGGGQSGNQIIGGPVPETTPAGGIAPGDTGGPGSSQTGGEDQNGPGGNAPGGSPGAPGGSGPGGAPG